jgi:hypothetical protein
VHACIMHRHALAIAFGFLFAGKQRGMPRRAPAFCLARSKTRRAPPTTSSTVPWNGKRGVRYASGKRDISAQFITQQTERNLSRVPRDRQAGRQAAR